MMKNLKFNSMKKIFKTLVYKIETKVFSMINNMIDKVDQIQKSLPNFMRDYFSYLKTSVSITTRIAYLNDIVFYLEYLILDEPTIDAIKNVPLSMLNDFTAQDFNFFIAEYCSRYEVNHNGQRVIHENSNTTLSRKKSSVMS